MDNLTLRYRLQLRVMGASMAKAALIGDGGGDGGDGGIVERLPGGDGLAVWN